MDFIFPGRSFYVFWQIIQPDFSQVHNTIVDPSDRLSITVQAIAAKHLFHFDIQAFTLVEGVNMPADNLFSNIMNKAIEYKRNDSEATVRIDGKPVKYDDSREHRNVVIADTLDVIENVILFSISNYFLRFSNEYKRFHKVESFKNDWYEYVEYGTTNPLTILLQRSGFSRETSTYIRQHRREYVVMAEDGGVKLRRTLLQSRNLGAARESADIQYNMPEIFVD